MKIPLSGEQACEIVNRWLVRPNVLLVSLAEQFWASFQEQVAEAQIA